jgi:hypothetical protein
LLYLLKRHPPASDSAEKLENANWGGGLHSGDFTTCAVFLCPLLLSSEMSPHSGINLRVYCAGVADAAHKRRHGGSRLDDDDTKECGRIQNRFITEIMIFFGFNQLFDLLQCKTKISLHGASNYYWKPIKTWSIEAGNRPFPTCLHL